MSRNLRVAQPVTSAIFQPLPNDNEASLQALRGGYSTTLPLLSIKQGNVVTAPNHNDKVAVIIHTAVGGGVLMDACGRIVGMAAVTVPPPSKGTEAALAASGNDEAVIPAAVSKALRTRVPSSARRRGPTTASEEAGDGEKSAEEVEAEAAATAEAAEELSPSLS